MFLLAAASLATASQEVIFVPHSETNWNVEERMQGQGILIKDKDGNQMASLDELQPREYQFVKGPKGEELLDLSVLTEKGEGQAKELGEKIIGSLGEERSAVLLSSDLLRCKQTTKIVEEVLRSSGIDVTVEYDARFREGQHGRLSGMRKNDGELYGKEVRGYKHLDYYIAYKNQSPSGMYENAMDPQYGENFVAVTARVHEAVLHYLHKHAGKKIVVVTHGGPIRGIFTHLTKDTMPFSEEYKSSQLYNCKMMKVNGYGSESAEITLE